MAWGNPLEYSPELDLTPARMPFLSFDIQGTSKGIGRGLRDRKAGGETPNSDRLSDPLFPLQSSRMPAPGVDAGRLDVLAQSLDCRLDRALLL